MIPLPYNTIKAEAAEQHRKAALYRAALLTRKAERARAREAAKRQRWKLQTLPRPVWRPATGQ